MENTPLYSIGHGNRSAEGFVDLLRQYEIAYLVDVRSQPYSRYNTQFRRKELKALLADHGIRYVYMGDALGGRPSDPSCYDENGKLDYGRLSVKEIFLNGIERLKNAHSKNIRAAVMCSESDPRRCHRSKLIGVALDQRGIPLRHIDEHGNIKDQETVMKEANKHKTGFDLFNPPPGQNPD